MNTLDFLTQFENDSISAYRALATETDNQELKGLYELLAETRQRHRDTLIALQEHIRKDEVDSRLVERARNIHSGFWDILHTQDMMKMMRSDHDAFDHVIRSEEEMIHLCEGIAKAEENEKAKALITWFVDDERKYLDEIEGIYDFVEAPHCYLEWGEFANLHPL